MRVCLLSLIIHLLGHFSIHMNWRYIWRNNWGICHIEIFLWLWVLINTLWCLRSFLWYILHSYFIKIRIFHEMRFISIMSYVCFSTHNTLRILRNKSINYEMFIWGLFSLHSRGFNIRKMNHWHASYCRGLYFLMIINKIFLSWKICLNSFPQFFLLLLHWHLYHLFLSIFFKYLR
jgi:hypothetical protein